MNQHENNILIEVASDIKWLKETNTIAHDAVIKHLQLLNGRVSKNTTRSTVNRYGLFINFSITAIIITILLHLMGVY